MTNKRTKKKDNEKFKKLDKPSVGYAKKKN